jgi:hypothetical protein
LKGKLPNLRGFKVEIGSVSSHEAYSAELKKHKDHSKENPVCVKLQHLTNYFSLSIEFVVKRNSSCQSSFSKYRKADFVPNGPIQHSG